jgi:hypothetical protein
MKGKKAAEGSRGWTARAPPPLRGCRHPPPPQRQDTPHQRPPPPHPPP